MRLFLALPLPTDVKDFAVATQRSLARRCRGWRWVRPEGLHLTVRFLGEVSAGRDAATRNAWRHVAEERAPLAVRPGPTGRFPPRGRARVLYLRLEDAGGGGALLDVAAVIERAARAAGFPAEPRPFVPHVTLARAERSRTPDEPAPPETPVPPLGLVRELLLFSSDLGAGGARYTAIDRYAFGRTPGCREQAGVRRG